MRGDGNELRLLPVEVGEAGVGGFEVFSEKLYSFASLNLTNNTSDKKGTGNNCKNKCSYINEYLLKVCRKNKTYKQKDPEQKRK